MALQALLPDPACLALESLTIQEGDIVFTVQTTNSSVSCPLCGNRARRVHSRYQRVLADLPWQANPVRIKMNARKYFCDNPECHRRVFTEPVPTVAARYKRKTKRLLEALEKLTHLAGGEVAAQIAKAFGLKLSPDCLLEVIKQETAPSVAVPRVVGIDDFAFKRGHVYGSIIVDLERHQPIDLLPDREASTVAQWLAQHPSIEVVSRDRGSGYKEGATQGAPQAVQVADRWHLLKNLGDALEDMLKRHHRQLKEVAQQVSLPSTQEPIELPVAFSEPTTSQTTRSQRHQEMSRQRREQAFQQVHLLRREGFNISGIAQQTGLARKTIRKYLESSTCPTYSSRRTKPGLLSPFEVYLQQRFAQGCHNAAILLAEIRAQGYRGKISILRQFLRQFRATPLADNCLHFKTPSACSLRWWLLGHYHSRDEEQESIRRRFVMTLVKQCPEIGAAQQIVLEFVTMVKEHRTTDLEDWLRRALDSESREIVGFAKGLLQDEAAVRESLSGKWSNGQVEGQVNRLKLLKRSMYGRGSFALLRARVLHRTKAIA